MPNIRVILWGVLAAILFLSYQTWLHDYEPTVSSVPQTSAAPAGAPASALGDSVPQPTTVSATAAAPPTTAPEPAATPAETSAPAALAAASAADSGPPVQLHVTTDVLDIGINLKGGELARADLLQYPLRKDTPNIPVRLLSYEPPPTRYLVQSGLTGGAGEAAPLTKWSGSQTKKPSSSRRARMSCACRSPGPTVRASR
jgi:YidC/Oxa1 family membrane protein insertase